MNKVNGRTLSFNTIYLFSALIMVVILFLLGMQKDEEKHNEIFIAFKDIMQLDHTLNDAVMQARAGISRDYDQIAQAVIELKAASHRLAQESTLPQGHTKDLVLSLDVAVKNKIELVERFKSTHALINIALLYLPRAHNYIYSHEELSSLVPALELLYKKIIIYYIVPEQADEVEIKELLSEFKQASFFYKNRPSNSFQELRSFAQQIDTILQYRRAIDGSIASITAIAIADKARVYQSIFANQIKAHRTRTLFSKILLALLCLILLAFLYRNTVRLTKTARALADINRELDQKVLDKTETILQQQATLTSTAKLSALGEMASGIAHEINNPLAIILGKARIVKMQIRKPVMDIDAVIAGIEVMEATGHRIAKIVKGLRTFSRNSDDDPFEREQISTIIQDVLELCHERFKHASIDVRVVVSENPYILCRATEIAQVLMNLLSNSFDVASKLPDRWVSIEVGLHQQTRVHIVVTDSGHGISPEVAAKIMQPFFTTKEVGSGTGLGLSISTGIIQRHLGSLSYDPQSAHTRFVIDLPIDQAVPQLKEA